jgi:ABC-2 type transport system permease protein
MRRVLAIFAVDMRRFLRYRSNVFFVFIFPMLLVLLLGATFAGGAEARVGAHVAGDGGPLADALLADLDAADGVDIVPFSSESRLVDAVQRGDVDAGFTVPAGYDAALEAGEQVDLGYVARPDSTSFLVRQAVTGLVDAHAGPIRAAQVAVSTEAGDFGRALGVARAAAAGGGPVEVRTFEVGGTVLAEFEGLGQFDLVAAQELVLFMFLTSLAGSAALIETRRLGMGRRMLSTPAGPGQILTGLAAGRMGVGLIQGGYIMAGTLVAFGVSWGDPIGAIALLLVFALVGASAGMLMGSIFKSEQQAGGLGVLIGLGFAAFGGAMVPIEVFPDGLVAAAHVTPHAWALDGFADLVRRDGTIIDILPELGVLAAFAAVFLAIGSWRLRRALTA